MSGAAKAGAGSPGCAPAARGTAVARSTARALIAASAAIVKLLIGARIGASIWINPSTLSQGVEHARRGQDLRQYDGLARADIEQIERHAAAAELLQEPGDF